jgi:Pyruvate/2-oxoacid:ferredoxin oxidoreductase gamma subunit
MKYNFKNIFSVIAVLMLTACGDPKIDASSDETMAESLQAIVDELPNEKKEQFKEAVTGIYMVGAFASMGSDKSKEEIQAAIAAKLDGKTADEIFAMAAELKD